MGCTLLVAPYSQRPGSALACPPARHAQAGAACPHRDRWARASQGGRAPAKWGVVPKRAAPPGPRTHTRTHKQKNVHTHKQTNAHTQAHVTPCSLWRRAAGGAVRGLRNGLLRGVKGVNVPSYSLLRSLWPSGMRGEEVLGEDKGTGEGAPLRGGPWGRGGQRGGGGGAGGRGGAAEHTWKTEHTR
jgi:hypothetical protein